MYRIAGADFTADDFDGLIMANIKKGCPGRDNLLYFNPITTPIRKRRLISIQSIQILERLLKPLYKLLFSGT